DVDWWAQNHGYDHVDVDAPAWFEARRAFTVLNACLVANSATAAARILGTLESQVVFDWGFPPEQMSVVQKLGDAGAHLWWFDGDRARARQEFIKRDTVPIECLDIQMPKIERAWEQIKSLFNPQLIDVLAADGRRRSPEEIWECISRHAI